MLRNGRNGKKWGQIMPSAVPEEFYRIPNCLNGLRRRNFLFGLVDRINSLNVSDRGGNDIGGNVKQGVMDEVKGSFNQQDKRDYELFYSPREGKVIVRYGPGKSFRYPERD